MTDNYAHGARRNYLAGGHLDDNAHREVAGYLFGVAAECAIKTILIRAGIPVGDRYAYRVHLPDLARRIRTVASGRAMRAFSKDPGRYRFGSWTIDHRYAEDGSITAAQINEWRDDAHELLRDAGIIVKR